ncbi:hypothetical protein QTP88_028873 [Uroleucon formosanum]
MENIFSNYDHAIEREQDKVFWPISLSNLNTANQITSFNIKKESNFLNIKKAKYQIFGRVLQSDSSDYPEKSIILLIDNFVGWLFKWIEVKIHGFFKDIEYPVYKGGFEIIFLRNSDDDALFRDRNEKNELAGVGKVIIDEFNIRIPIVTYDDMSKIKLINELTLLSKRNEYMFRFKSRNITVIVMADDKEIDRITRMAERAAIKRSTVIEHIKQIHAMAMSVRDDASLASTLSVLVTDLDSLWTQFKMEDDFHLDCLLLLGKSDQYLYSLSSETRRLIGEAKAVAASFIPTGAEAIDLSYINQRVPSSQDSDVIVKNSPRLPEIPLPKFSGEFREWPAFRDKFSALVNSRSDLSNFEKIYYLMGCLEGAAAEAVQSIPVAGDNYTLVWSTLSERFNRPRLVATSLVEQLLHTPPMTHESLHDLNSFLCTFHENFSLINALKLPDLGSFILFTMAFRCLPVHTRKTFEASNTAEYPSITQLLEFVRSRVAILEVVGDTKKSSVLAASKDGKSTGQSVKGGDPLGKRSSSRAMSFVTAKTDVKCPCCSEQHKLTSCIKFKSWTNEDRVRWTRENRLCFICFGADHWVPRCKSKPNCNKCTRRHHFLLHSSEDESRDKDETPPANVSNVSMCAAVRRSPKPAATSVLLGTALVHVRDRSGSWHTLRALVDCASQISAITDVCVTRLGLKRSRWTAPISGLSGTSVVNVLGRVDCVVQPRFSSEPALSVRAWILPTITGDLPKQSLSSGIKDRYSNLALADPHFDVSSPVDLLLGGDVYASIMDGRKVSIDNALPSAFSSIFGWILIGPVSDSETRAYQSLPVCMTLSLECLMDKFWQVEEPAMVPSTFTDNGQCEKLFSEQMGRLPSGRFSVPLPFRSQVSSETFVGSREVAARRFEMLERKLSSNPKLKSLYDKFMSDYISLGHMSLAQSPGHYFIPHHAIFRPEIDDSKIRVVFDASARGFRGPSLNQCLFPGPKLHQDIIDILIRFRVSKHVFTTDICKMYRQILVKPEHRKFQHVLWRASPHDAVREYELHTVTYGVNCAPFLALRVLQYIASNDCEHFDSVRHALLRQTYVDDICTGADSIAELLQVQSDLIGVLKKSGLELKKWASNTPSVLEAVPMDDRVSVPLPFESVEGYGTRILGLEWHPEGDFFSCALSLSPSPVFSKRGILSLVARIFDPLGVFGPSVFLAKVIMQRTWLTGLRWDDPLPADISDEWRAFVSDLPALLNIRVPRYINARQGAPCYLLGFCDASQRGYAAVVYVRMADVPGTRSVSLLGTKTKLAPTKATTIPRLELNAALLLARWLSRIRDILAPQLNIIGVRAWSDSTVVLSWLQIPHESFKIYVSNRVHQVHTLLPDCQWSYVESHNNPADCASRGIMPTALSQLDLYWRGPQLTLSDPSEWDQPTPALPLSSLPETQLVSCAARLDAAPIEWFDRFSDYDRMLRVVAYMHRFIDTCRRRCAELNPPVFLRKAELDRAAQVLAADSQRVYFAELLRELSAGNRISSRPLARLSPFVDPVGVLRVGGRLRHSTLNYDCKHPILLHKRSHFSLLLCRRWHRATCHAGPRVLVTLISRQFWVVSLRSVLHSVISTCVVCVRHDAKPLQPYMADLPDTRVQQRRPFERVGVDYAGPLQMRELSLRKSRVVKIYVSVFVCFCTKAVHLEVVTDLSTDAFLAAFDRFIARRGLPSDVFSDCGTNFIGADRQLRMLLESPEGQAAIANTRAACVWHFNPPSAPHFGGLWEAAVRSTKRLLVRVIGTHIFTYEEFSTVLARVEAILNSRPLTPASSDPHDLDCLTPGHFLIGQPLLAIPPRSNPESSIKLTQRWKLMDQCHQAFWRRWSAEYLTTLQERSKWTEGVPNLKVNDMVIVVDNQSPPLMWRLGRVLELLPGTDGHVRVVRVMTRLGIVTRPVVKLVPLPAN